MKIVMIAGNGGSGGLIGYIKGLMSENTFPKGCEVTLFCGENLAIQLKKINTTVKIIETKHALEKWTDIIFNKPLHKDFINQVEEESPDIIFFLNGYIRKGLEKYPNVMTLHNQLHIDFFQLMRHGFSKTTITLMAFCYAVRRSMKKAEGVVFLSQFSKDQTDRKKIKYNNGRVIPFGFEEENRLKVMPIETETNEKIKIIYVSAIYPYKNHINLIKACHKLKTDGYDIELSLIGQKVEPFFNRVKKVIDKLNLEDEIIFYDWVSHSNIKNLIDSSNIFIYASSTETTGYGLLEGMARGSLIASSDKAGFPSMLKDGGVYFNPKDVMSVKKAIKSLINLSSNEKMKLRTKAWMYSNEYSWEKTIEEHYKYMELFYKEKTSKGF